MRHNPTDSEIKRLAVAMLQQGLLVSELPGTLMTEFNLSREKARRLAIEALKQYREYTRETNRS